MPDPERCLLVFPRLLPHALAMRGLISSLAATGRQLVAVTAGEQAALLDPALMALRLENTPEHLDAPLSLPRDSASPERLRSLGFAEAVLCEPSWWAARSMAAGIPRRRGPMGGLFGPFLTERFRLEGAGVGPAGAAQRARALAEALGLAWRPMPLLHRPEMWQRIGRDRLVNAKIDPEAPCVGLYLGNHGGRDGVWPGERVEELARQLRRRRPTLQIVLLAVEADLWQSVLLYERTGKIHPVVGPDLAADGHAAVISHLDLVVSADSSFLHIAAAVGTPCLGLYAQKSEEWGPLGEGCHRVQRRPLKKLEVAEVLERCEAILESESEGAAAASPPSAE
ncbi:MAG: glycosyltransferase family 9 protein [Acidobacteriota bacterium]